MFQFVWPWRSKPITVLVNEEPLENQRGIGLDFCGGQLVCLGCTNVHDDDWLAGGCSQLITEAGQRPLHRGAIIPHRRTDCDRHFAGRYALAGLSAAERRQLCALLLRLQAGLADEG